VLVGAKLLCWSLLLQEFQLEIYHVRGYVVAEDWTITAHDTAKTEMAWVADCQ